MAPSLSEDRTNATVGRTEGWAAGLPAGRPKTALEFFANELKQAAPSRG